MAGTSPAMTRRGSTNRMPGEERRHAHRPHARRHRRPGHRIGRRRHVCGDRGRPRPRGVYVDFLTTGPAVSKTLRGVVTRTGGIRKAGDLLVVDLVRVDGEVAGAAALHLPSGAPVTIAAKATIVATGGLTRLY